MYHINLKKKNVFERLFHREWFEGIKKTIIFALFSLLRNKVYEALYAYGFSNYHKFTGVFLFFKYIRSYFISGAKPK